MRRALTRLFPSLNCDLGIDLGTANVLVFVRGKGVVIQEPSVVALDSKKNLVLAVGDDAKRMIGRTPGNVVAVRPLRDGVIADFDITENHVETFYSKSIGSQALLYKTSHYNWNTIWNYRG